MILKRLISFMTLVTLVMTFISCSEEIYERETHSTQRKTKDVITFKQFKEQTGIKDFMSLRSFSLTGENNRSVEEDYLIDTLTVMYFASPTGKDTYTFKIYPITEDLNPKEYYNLVYEKNGSIWNEIIFKNKEKDNPQPGESILEFSEMIYNRQHFSLSFAQFCEVITITNANCNCLNRNNCDWCEQCIRVQVTYEYCPSSGSGSSGSGGIIVGPGDSGGGGTFNGIYIPNPYEPGEEDLNNPDFVLSMNVAAWTRTLPVNLKNAIASVSWMYPNIVFYMKNNGGLTQENKNAITFALTHFPTIRNTVIPNSTFTEMELFHYGAFNFLVKYPTQAHADVFTQIITSITAGNFLGLSPFFKYPNNSNYATLYPNFTMLVKDYIPSIKTEQPLLAAIHNLTGVSPETILDELTWGNGPEINIAQLGVDPNGNQYYGKFNKNEPDKIYIDIDLVQQLEAMNNIQNPTPQQNQQIALLNAMVTFSVCLHEYVHFSDFAFDGSMQDNENLELGLLFEELFMGGFYDFNTQGDVVFIKAN